jgi:hypothetical protein
MIYQLRVNKLSIINTIDKTGQHRIIKTHAVV